MLHLYIEPERVIEATVRTFESVPEPNWYNLISDKEVEPCTVSYTHLTLPTICSV